MTEYDSDTSQRAPSIQAIAEDPDQFSDETYDILARAGDEDDHQALLDYVEDHEYTAENRPFNVVRIEEVVAEDVAALYNEVDAVETLQINRPLRF